MTDDTFCRSRFWLYFKKEMTERKRFYMLMLLGLYGGLTLMMWYGNLISGVDEEISDDITGLGAGRIFIWSIGALITHVSASLMLAKLRTKPGRISMLTTPASMLEKYLVNILIYVVLIIPIYAICVQAADLTRFLLVKLTNPQVNVTPPIDFCWGAVKSVWNIHPLLLSLLILLNLLIVSFYTFGAVIWPKYSCVKTYAAMYVVTMAGLILLAIITHILPNIWDFISKCMNWLDGTGSLIIANLALLGGSFLMFRWSYILLCRRDLQPLKVI